MVDCLMALAGACKRHHDSIIGIADTINIGIPPPQAPHIITRYLSATLSAFFPYHPSIILDNGRYLHLADTPKNSSIIFRFS